MIISSYNFLKDIISDIANVSHYYTFRFGFSILFSMIFTILIMPRFIKLLTNLYPKGQPIRNLDQLENHKDKKKTPTMGGILIIFSTLLTLILIGDLTNYYLLICIFNFLSYGLIGFLDDYLKINKKYINIKKIFFKNTKIETKELGISPKIKSLLQLVFAIITVNLFNLTDGSIYYSSILSFPFLKNITIQLGLLYTVLRILTIIGASNAVNITDGLDGLVTIPLVFNFLTFGFIIYLTSNAQYAKYLFIFHQPEIAEVLIMCGAIIGSLVGFLWFNIKPAQIFMGDVGSLSLGGLLGAIAVMTKNEILLMITGGLFVMETLSVIIQVWYFKLTKGKRIFKMSPIHHHFEIKGWSEMQVVIRFWIIALIFTLIGLSSIKLR